ncbi:hypothetical protein GRF59_09295 [Paenibacillus sp. HJL G12]|uniref:DUF1232 domain-containing protein n=1 Tax=Paenibacillus dendrobii TaxID=2691084 RepID=A0A7X3IH35_9BACL|nr:hypothetical protein [Paenibacillus dendrobii]MWV43829.1 hypothetical protein [Paenibacillus dendrobii]
MKWRRLLSIRRWSQMTGQLWRYLSSSQVSILDKLLFLVPVLLYWVLPDVMPFVPIDDIGVTLIVMGWFVSRMEKKYPSLTSTVIHGPPKGRKR